MNLKLVIILLTTALIDGLIEIKNKYVIGWKKSSPAIENILATLGKFIIVLKDRGRKLIANPLF